MLIREVIPNREGINRSLNPTEMINHHVFCTSLVSDLDIKLLKKKHPADQSGFSIKLLQQVPQVCMVSIENNMGGKQIRFEFI